MQLCEEGKISGLDDEDLIEKVCPELKSMKILKNVDENGKPQYVDKKNRITLRQLLTHTGKETPFFLLSNGTVYLTIRSQLASGKMRFPRQPKIRALRAIERT